MKYSISGKLADFFQNNSITPLIAMLALLLGIFALFITPREEEPQIDVTFVNVYIALPGSSAKEIENLISYPAEQVLDSIAGVKHIYSISKPGLAIISVQFKVGVKRKDAIVKLYNEIYSNSDWLPDSLGASKPLIKPMGIDDVPIVTLTLWSDIPEKTNSQLQKVARALEIEIKRIPNTRIVKTIGGPKQVVHIQLNPQTLAAYNLDFNTIEKALKSSNFATHSGQISINNQVHQIDSGTLLSNVDEIKNLVVSVHNGAPVYLTDIATIVKGPDSPENYVWISPGYAWEKSPKPNFSPAVTLSIGKKAGTNAVKISDSIIAINEALKLTHIPSDVHVEVTRNYGITANEISNKLMTKLFFATVSVVILILITLGWRESIVVGLAVTITLAVTLFASWAIGFTLNRVSLFAMIFSIGILVDDAVVIVENIHRHLSVGKKKLSEIIPVAVDEVGGPTILATFTVIAALMPMAFVSGLMGPYMSPIPINASIGMLLSLLIALIITPWLFKVIIGHKVNQHKSTIHNKSIFKLLINPFLLQSKKGRLNRYIIVIGVVIVMLISMLLIPTQKVILKMLPFDNKSEIQIIIDAPEGTTLETTNQVLTEIANYLKEVPEIEMVVSYAGTASPINFNGLIRQYFLRNGTNVGDLQILLKDKKNRDRQSHEIAFAIRANVTEIANKHGVISKIVEVPPGPPVHAPLVAEIYGQSDRQRKDTAIMVAKQFEKAQGIIDIDTSIETQHPRKIITIDQAKAAKFGISITHISKDIQTALKGHDISYLHDPNSKYSLPIRIELETNIQNDIQSILSIPLINKMGNSILLSELVTLKDINNDNAIFHKDLLPVSFVTANIAGFQDSPLYGIMEITELIKKNHPDVKQEFIKVPAFINQASLKWDGEWEITYKTFRDMGIAYGVGLILIYLLIVAQFGSYFVPLIIMTPIPLTIIGVLPGHWISGSQFTATSMIGMIALAGIIVRNSILLVDFINVQLNKNTPLRQAVISSSIVRAKPIVLTGLAAMMGAFFILDDPIFNGLAVSLISGILVSTLLTLILIPVLYYWYISRFKKTIK